MKLFTIVGNKIIKGAKITNCGKYNVPGISVGKKGKFCKESYIPVQEAKNTIIHFGELGKTLRGKQKIIAEKHTNKNKCIVVCRAGSDHTGANYYTGADSMRFPCKILVRGFASKEGAEKTSDHLIIVMKKDERFAIHTDVSYIYTFNGEKLTGEKVFPPTASNTSGISRYFK